MTTRLFFTGVDASTLTGLWVSDGTSAGTTQVAVTGAYSGGLDPTNMVSFDGKLYFSGNTQPYSNPVLWVSDGTTAGTTPLAVPGANANFFPTNLTTISGALVFSGADTNDQTGLWISDGTGAGTLELTITGADPVNGINPDTLVAFNSFLYFDGTDSSGLHGLWVSDGTNAGTTELMPAGASTTQGLHPSYTVVFDGKLYFQGIDGSQYQNFWVSDGTAVGTVKLSVNGAFAGGLSPNRLTVVGDKLYFNGIDTDGNHGLWVTDGTAPGTHELTVAGASASGVDPQAMVAFGGKLYFIGQDTSGNLGLWDSDGTNAGTVELALAQADSSGLDNAVMSVFGDKLVFSGDGPSDNTDLWVSDGTAAGTQPLTSVTGAAVYGVSPRNFVTLTTPPPAPAALTLSPASDTGTLGDDITSVNAPVITGTGIAGDTITLYDTDGTTPVGSVVVGLDGHWSITTLQLTNGMHTLSARQTDVDSTVSAASVTLSLTINAPPPVAPVDLSLAPATDSGTVGDRITNVTVPAIIGSGTPGDTVTLYDTDGTTPVGSAVVDQSGTWVITTIALTNGVHSLTAKQTDVNSTASVASAALVLTIDNAEPAPTGLALAAASDSGLVGDRVTSVTTPVITGLGMPGDTVTLYDGLTVVGTAVVAGNGTWSVTSAMLAAGVHSLTSTQTDIAGNISPASAALALTITSLSAALAANPHNGNGVVYNELFHGAADPNVTVTISDNGVVIGTAMADADGAWSFDLAVLEAGGHALSASVTDPNGHVSATPVVPLTLDTQSLPDTRFSLVSTNASGHFFGSDYAGPTDYLRAEYGYDGTDNVYLVANVANVFLYSGTGGQDVMVAKAGSNVLDGRSGSNWMVGATGADGGTDTFFVDNRSGQVAWSSLVNFHAGDMLTLWGFDPVAGVAQFSDNMGAAGYQGTTLQATLGDGSGGVDTVTFVGLSADTAQFTTSTGTAGGVNYMAVTRVS